METLQFARRALTDRGATHPRRRLRPFVWNEDYLHLRRLAEWIGSHPPSTTGVVLDIGAGDSPYRSLVRAKSYVALDLERGDHTSVLGDAHALPFGDGQIDMVLMFQVLPSIAHPEPAMREVLRVLKPGGQLVATTGGIWPCVGSDDFRRWTDPGLRQLLAPFAHVALYPMGGPAAVCAALMARSVGETARGRPPGMARTVGRIMAAGFAGMLNTTALVVEEALRESRGYQTLGESMTDAYVAVACKQG